MTPPCRAVSIFCPALPSFEARARGLAEDLSERGWAVDCTTLSRSAVAAAFCRGRAVVGFCPPAILIRSLPLGDKQRDAPVLVLSSAAEEGERERIVVLLGSHRGARRLAADIAQSLGAERVEFSASEQRLGFALDDPPCGWALQCSSPERLEQAMKSLARGAPYSVSGAAREGFPPPQFFQRASTKDEAQVQFTISNRCPSPAEEAEAEEVEGILVIRCVPRTLAVGIGCVRGVAASAIEAAVECSLAEARLSRSAVAAVASLTLKGSEAGLLQFAQAWHIPLRLFDGARLREETEARGLSRSSLVEGSVGTPNVAEAAALCLAEAGAVLRLAKRKFEGVTCAIAESVQLLLPSRLTGSACGHLTLVGLGPGGANQRTFEAAQALREAEDLFGYQLYLDLLERGETSPTAVRHAFALGAEEERSRAAIACARRGRRVALLASGDAGVYGLATLVWQILAAEKDAPPLHVAQAPGVSAMHALAARIGAPLGDDFCAISLSDLMTPKEKILQRLQCAAEGDFVVALYNPQSARRTQLLEQAFTILRNARPPSTAVACGRNLGREGERITLGVLEDFDTREVDMLSIVIIGSRATQRFDSPSGARFYTERGYRLANLRGES